MSEVIFPDWIPNWTIASWDRILFSDTSDAWTTKDDDVVNLPISIATQTALDNKVDKVTWKWLSTNDYDNTEKAKVDWAVQTIVAGTNVTVSRVWNSVTINSTWWGWGGWGAVDSVNWQTGIVVLDTDDISEGITNKYLSATDKTDLTDGWDSTLHYHASDRNRANHTWTQTMSTISDAWNLATLDQVDTSQIVNHAVENTKLANMNSNTVKGRLSWNGTPQDIPMEDLPINTATLTALNWKVSTTWNETIAGIKTFTSPVLSNDVRLTNGIATQWETHADLTVIVRTATTANITLSGTQTIDWQALVANDLVLVKNQSTWSQNWVYVVNAGAWTRATNYNVTDHFNRRYVYAISGTTNTATLWICNTRNPTVWTTATTFAQIPLWIGTGSNQAAAGNHTHTSIATTAASTIWSSIWYRFTSRTATATTGANDLVVVFSWSTASQVETIPAGTAVSNNSGRFITFKNNATVPWTIRQSASNTLDWSASDLTLWVWETISVFNTALNTWVSLNRITASGWGTQIRKMFAIAWTIWATGTNVANTVVVDWSYTISKINMWLWTAWAGATDLIVDINLNWTSICSTTKPKITWTNQSSINTWTITTTTCVSWNVFTIDIDQIQSTPWVDLYVELVLI